MDDLFLPLSDSIQIPTDQIKYFASVLISIPLCIAFRYLPNNSNLKHFMYGMTGFILSYLVFGLGMISSFYTSVPSYFVMKYFKTQKAANCCFIFIFGYLLYRHIILYFYQYLEWSLDFTTTHMILTLKLTAFCFSVANAQKKNLSPYLEAHKVEKYPTLLEYFGFVYFFPGLFSGPSLEYRDYMSFIDMTRFKENNYKLVSIPYIQFAMNFLGGISLYACYILVGFFSPPDPEYYILEHPETCGLLFKLLSIWTTVGSLHFKYFGTWKLTESLGNLSGCGFSGFVNGKPTFVYYENVHIYKFETSRSAKTNFDIWNTYVQRWLKNYVYTTIGLTPLSPWKTHLTLFVSAFWHGVYPGYYITFLSFTVHKNASNQIYKKVDPYMERMFGKNSWKYKSYDVLLRIYNHWSLNYTVYPFMRFEFIPSLIVLKRTYFLGILVPFVIYQYLLRFVNYPPKATPPPTKQNDHSISS
ncbi:Vacuolar protein sorting 26 [Entamoeba marina]